jgi:hypothetical protein
LCGLIFLCGCNQPVSPSEAAAPEEKSHSRPRSPKGLPERTAIPDPRGVDFVDVADERGLDYSWPAQRRPMRVLDAFGCGCAAFDADNDGWQDVLLVDSPCPTLYRNVGGARFERASDCGLSDVAGDWKGCAIGDYDGDGLLDVLLTGYHCLALHKNLGGLRFELVTEAAGLDAMNHGHWGASAGFMDLDGDGWLDLVIVNCIVFGPDSRQYCELIPGVVSGCMPRLFPPERGEIRRNTGRGTFELVPDTAGMNQTHGIGLVLAFIDVDDDGRLDFYVGNDGVPADFLYNRGSMHFENRAMACGLAVDGRGGSVSAMGADWGDFNRDGLLDLTVTNFQKLSFPVFRNEGECNFVDVSGRTGIGRATWNRLGFGAKWVDFENDGWLDLFFVNGHVYDNAAQVEGSGSQFRQPLCLFHNDSGNQFVDLITAFGADVQRTMVGRGSATADFNNDGLVDLLAVDYEGPVMLLENRTRTGNHWLKLDLRGRAPNVFAYGARLVGKAGDQVWVSDVAPASSYLSSSDPRIHWGLGKTLRLETVEVRWPSGTTQTVRDISADQILRIEEPPLEIPVQESLTGKERRN